MHYSHTIRHNRNDSKRIAVPSGVRAAIDGAVDVPYGVHPDLDRTFSGKCRLPDGEPALAIGAAVSPHPIANPL